MPIPPLFHNKIKKILNRHKTLTKVFYYDGMGENDQPPRFNRRRALQYGLRTGLITMGVGSLFIGEGGRIANTVSWSEGEINNGIRLWIGSTKKAPVEKITLFPHSIHVEAKGKEKEKHLWGWRDSYTIYYRDPGFKLIFNRPSIGRLDLITENTAAKDPITLELPPAFSGKLDAACAQALVIEGLTDGDIDKAKAAARETIRKFITDPKRLKFASPLFNNLQLEQKIELSCRPNTLLKGKTKSLNLQDVIAEEYATYKAMQITPASYRQKLLDEPDKTLDLGR